MKILNILIIEDEDSQLTIYKDTIEQFNEKGEIKIEYQICEKFDDGQRALLSPSFDAAIIDLKLSGNIEFEGKQLVESVYKKIRIPIFVVSGSIPQIDHIKENALFKKRKRTHIFSEILEEIVALYKTGITSFLKPNGIVDQKLSEIFWNNLANDITIWIEHNNRNTLLRYILSHFQEHLEVNDDGYFEEYHPSEVYIVPPIKKHMHTGDLIKFQNQFYIILTPACDIVIQKFDKDEKGNFLPIRRAESIMLASVKEFDISHYCKGNKGNLDKSKIYEFVQNRQYRFHYLPPYLNTNGYLIDFLDLKTINCDSQIERMASISAPFIKDIVSRFSTYYARQGQPTFGQKKILDKMLDALQTSKL